MAKTLTWLVDSCVGTCRSGTNRIDSSSPLPMAGRPDALHDSYHALHDNRGCKNIAIFAEDRYAKLLQVKNNE